MLKPSFGSSAWIDQTTLPVRWSSATSFASSWPTKTLAVAEPEPARRPSAAGPRDVRIDVRLVFPQHVAGVDVDRERIVVARHDVDDAVVHDRLRLIGAARPHAGAAERCAPHGAQVRDVVAVDLRQRRVALVGEVAAVREPARARQRRQIAVAKSGRAPDRRRLRDGCALQRRQCDRAEERRAARHRPCTHRSPGKRAETLLTFRPMRLGWPTKLQLSALGRVRHTRLAAR